PLVGYAARLNHDQGLLPRNTAGVPKGVEDQALAHQFKVCFQYRFAKIREQHRLREPKKCQPRTRQRGTLSRREAACQVQSLTSAYFARSEEHTSELQSPD